MTREEKLQNEWLKDNKPKKIVPTKELAVNKIVDLDEKKISTKFNNQIEYKSDDKEENEYLNKITDEDIQILKTFQDKFINDLKIKESEWIEKKADIQDMYFCVDSEIKNTKFKNRIIEGIERHRLSEYLKKERGLGREILNLGIFLENLSVNDDTRYWLFKKSKKYEKIRESLYSIIVQI
ncbi:MAG: hypothetical protein PQJ44_05265, partial [Sphaerochaetaceae bacterium]|nr:hypothetical protein [Sphaerochaetaceae bacterium]